MKKIFNKNGPLSIFIYLTIGAWHISTIEILKSADVSLIGKIFFAIGLFLSFAYFIISNCTKD